MDLSNLKPAEGSVHRKKRIGRGQGSGYGGTSTRGHNGQKSRSGYSKKIGFEGGQMPLQRRVPKFGFKNVNHVAYKGVNLDFLQTLIDNKKVKEINPEIIVANGFAHKNDLIKILGRGEIKTGISISAHGFSASAKTAIEKAGGTVVLLAPYKKAQEKSTTTVDNKPKKEEKKAVVEAAVQKED